MVLWTAVAWGGPNGDAAPTETEPACDPPQLEAALPAPGAVGVPTDAIVTLLVPGTAAQCGVAAILGDDHGEVVPVTVDVVGELVRLRPDGLLPDREYTAVVQFQAGTLETSFTTGSDAPAPLPEPSDVEVEIGAVCGSSLFVDAQATATLAADGVLALAVVGEAVDVELDHAVLPSGTVTLRGSIAAVREPCAVLRLADVTGAVVWESEPACAVVDCPVPDPLVDVTIEVDRACEQGATTSAIVTVELPAEPPDAGGTIVAELVTERATGRSVAIPWLPGQRIDLAVSAAGEHDACATVSYHDIWGDEQWVTAPVCAPPGEPCAWDDDLDGVGGSCGCESGGGPVVLAPLAFLLGIGHRRRRS